MKPSAKTSSLHILKSGFSGDKRVVKLDEDKLAKLQSTLLGMLKDFIDVANKYSIGYTLSGGSVLGAVRHQGFIPWDDDVDINMPRKDFDVFSRVFEKELGDKYDLSSPYKMNGHGMTVVQIKKRGTIYRSFNELSKSVLDCGICIDIFVVENVPNNALRRKIHGFLCLALGYLSTCRKTYEDMPYLRAHLDKGSAAEGIFKKKAKIGGIFRWLSLDWIVRATVKFYSLCKNNNSKYVTIPSGRNHYFGEMQLRSDLCEATKVPFEDIVVNIPRGYENYLSSLYGEDYMTLPPPEKREMHPLMEIDFGD